jgi:valine--pyruvate aminotransferase
MKSLAGPSGIQALMDDLGQAMTIHPDMRMLGGGQPAAIPEVQSLWRQRVAEMLQDGTALDRALLNYDPPGGNPHFKEAAAEFFQRECGWPVHVENIAIISGSQTAMFFLFNYLADGGRKILFPLLPDYIGYANQDLRPGMLHGVPGIIEETGPHEFKYRVDFDRVKLDHSIGAMALSCPTNPTGNVITQDEFDRLKQMAQQAGVPFILDCAYGYPFPNVVYTGFEPQWEPGLIFSISLSKIGLPGVRTSIVVADPHIVTALRNINAIVSLANGNLGQAILLPLLKDDRLMKISREVVRPFYKQRSDLAVSIIQQTLNQGGGDWALHRQDGAFFLWLWLKELRISAAELYERLKARKVLVIPGHYFSFGLEEPWQHASQCLRITFSQPEHIVREGLEILAEEVRAAS